MVTATLGCGASPAVTDDAAARGDLAGDAAETSVAMQGDAAADALTDAVWEGGQVIGVRADRPAECPARTPIADTFDWSPPRVARGACSAAEIEMVGALLARSVPTEAMLRRSLSAQCFSCAFSQPDDPTWSALTLSRELPPQWRANEGGCLVAAGASEACGRAYNNFQQCAWAACDGCGFAEGSACYLDPMIFAAGAACDGYRAQYRRACPAVSRAYNTCIDEAETELPDIARRLLGVMCGPAVDAGR